MTIHEIVLDDGGMNLLSSAMLGWIGERVAELQGCSVAEEPGGPALEAPQPILILRSARPHLFAAGADMAEMRGFGAGEAEVLARQGQEVMAAIERLPFVTVAMIDGDCFGGALDLALAFDLRFAAPASRFSHPGAKIGIVTGFGGTSRWRKVLAPAAAKQLFLANRVLTAEDALSIGLVDCVGDSFDDELGRLTALDPRTTRFLKELTAHDDRLTASQRLLLAERLGRLYDF
ncbi:MAG TPA: enoyl-CoA hydratase/isomerase family protein [Thermoanaerobaculia bacterium]|nr:enoyl-CoA hydratase/isomerase family protein [Thermoanaerobaculia bacterium]